ncbi:hypothetical protein AMIS_39340 [Actinoplanes missouriensis 431]|uniref:Uncharacterized protein n=1 Tax=Actinoplanes missouriensis (strain ATCC 14538 / DSM 43046 / CBS 188.64 / JCM 3121 / NBRC 102363 / NCIMB 12654 / NRRL B-3342 / UNCC 431) TaxID=512565 RepID=I0H817_ACTM4|nr:hypothetical protein [Actinoplanes missouriensis]BAL89154.1 hypothetical protein AMIS_39340 [Actinoplanes missouriensis 431]
MSIANLGLAGDLSVATYPSLANDVANRACLPIGAVRPVTWAPGSTSPMAATPIELLHKLGRVSSYLPTLQHAGAAGLSGHIALNFASVWAIIRYLWAFDAPSVNPAQLRFSTITDELKKRSRALFSEHFGIALAVHLVEQHVANPTTAPITVDVDTAVSVPGSGAPLPAFGMERPDYLTFTTNANGRPQVIAIEAKGNVGGRSNSVRQLARAVQQLMATPSVAKHLHRGIAVATSITNLVLRSYAVELHPALASGRFVEEVAFAQRLPIEDRYFFWEDVLRRDAAALADYNNTEEIIPPNGISVNLPLIRDAGLLTFSGIPVSTSAILESHADQSRWKNESSTLRGLTGSLVTHPFRDVEYRGRWVIDPVHANTQVFTGMEERIASSLFPENITHDRGNREEVDADPLPPVHEKLPGGGLRVTTRQPSGTILVVQSRGT